MYDHVFYFFLDEGEEVEEGVVVETAAETEL
jgi:hypothetical protein